jgi:hypothetical protein
MKKTRAVKSRATVPLSKFSISVCGILLFGVFRLRNYRKIKKYKNVGKFTGLQLQTKKRIRMPTSDSCQAIHIVY